MPEPPKCPQGRFIIPGIQTALQVEGILHTTANMYQENLQIQTRINTMLQNCARDQISITKVVVTKDDNEQCAIDGVQNTANVSSSESEPRGVEEMMENDERNNLLSSCNNEVDYHVLNQTTSTHQFVVSLSAEDKQKLDAIKFGLELNKTRIENDKKLALEQRESLKQILGYDVDDDTDDDDAYNGSSAVFPNNASTPNHETGSFTWFRENLLKSLQYTFTCTPRKRIALVLATTALLAITCWSVKDNLKRVQVNSAQLLVTTMPSSAATIMVDNIKNRSTLLLSALGKQDGEKALFLLVT